MARLRALFAGGSATLVLALAVFAVSPHWHEALHAESTAATNEGCAVDLFAHGLSVPLGGLAVQPTLISPRAGETPPAREIFPPAPRYLHQPERGPPFLG